MKITKKEAILILIIVCLAIGWVNAVITQQNTITRVKGLYNHLVNECNEIIGVQDLKDFCVTLPDGTKVCEQNDLNALQSFG